MAGAIQAVGVVGKVVGIGAGLINLLLPGPQPLDFFIGTSIAQPEVIFGDGSNLPHTPGVEVPEEFGPIGGVQTIASHDFPGGIRTLQQMGAFPETLRWKGILLGSQAFARAATMDRLRINNGAPLLYLKYGPWLWQGYLAGFRAKARHQWLVEYDAEFEPQSDMTNTAAVIAAQPGSLFEEAIADIEKWLGSQIVGELGALAAAISSVETVLLVIGLAGLAADPALVQNAINGAAGPNGALTQASKSSNPATAAVVGDVLSQILILAGLFPVAPVIATQVPAINPNLPALAAKYLGDQSQWPSIAEANNLLTTLPIGVFRQLNIPQPSAST